MLPIFSIFYYKKTFFDSLLLTKFTLVFTLAGRNPDATSRRYSYAVNYSLESFLYLFHRIKNPEETVIDQQYRDIQLRHLMDVAKILVIPNQCLSVMFELHLGDPKICPGPDTIPTACEDCPFCEGQMDKLFPRFSRQGAKTLLFHLFLDNGDYAIDGLKVLDNITSAVKKYQKLKLQQHEKGAMELLFGRQTKEIKPKLIKTTLFVLVVAGILHLDIKQEGDQYEVVFSLTKNTLRPDTLSMNDEDVWNSFQHKHY